MIIVIIRLPWLFPKHQIVLQDFILPINQICCFLNNLQSLLSHDNNTNDNDNNNNNNNKGLWPIWLLPMRGDLSSSSSIFDLPQQQQSPHYCNVGAYGIPKTNNYDFINDNKNMELLLHRHNGRKVNCCYVFVVVILVNYCCHCKYR